MKPGQPLTLEEVARLVDGIPEGASSSPFTGIADLATAGENDISFLSHPRYRQRAEQTRAGLLLLPPEETVSFAGATVRVENPSGAFGRLIEHFLPPVNDPAPGIHPKAIVDEGATVPASVHVGAGSVIEAGVRIGEDTTIGPGCLIGRESQIGNNCTLHAGVILRERTLLGSRVILQPGAVIGSDGFGYEFEEGRHKKIPQVGFVQIDDDVEIGANTTIDRGRFGRTWIKEGTKIDNLVMVAHNVSIGPHAIIVAQCGISGSSHLGSHVTMAGQSAVVGHVEVGDQVTLTAWTAVTKDILEKGIYRGGPARPMKESMRIEALTARLPELYQRIRDLEKALSKSKEKE
jgi:UDP-3-O-[3-hydroxymyristoyl] glucosamine N-acyltransferase